ncbi:cellulose binding domain-containing protein [Singulisphaera sp. Ch08]|uniref:Cellulose binding domain-containing protein n=1 Tax=Singulisphaera sp. Ch08 TaxID=3120278 RepID=A0AAU7CCX3_9BACT
MSLNNSQPTSVADWRLEFDLDAKITSIWDATIVSQTGNHYVIAGAAWDKTIPAGGVVSFGFVANASHSAAPSHEVLNGIPLGTPLPVVPGLSISDASVAEGNTGTTDLTFVVNLSEPAATAVAVSYTTSDGTAKGGSDYQTSHGTLNFAPGETRKTINVRVNGDLLVEPDETLIVSLVSPTGATLVRDRATGTIRNDDTPPLPPANGDVEFKVTSDWVSGFNGEVVVHNRVTTPMNDWTLEFDFAGQITSLWNGVLVNRNGNHVVVKGADWNKTIAPGSSVSFGFTASPGGNGAGLTNFVLQGQSTGGSGGGGATNHAPVAVADSAFTSAGQPVPINVLSNDSDPDRDPISLTSFTQSQNGTVSVNAAGTLTYTPKPGFTGLDSFSYIVSDGRGGTDTASVAVTVSAPVAPSIWPAQFYAPYVDMGLYPTYNLAAAAQSTGVKYFTLAFIVADPQNQPSWGGYSEYAVNGGEFDLNMRSQVAAVRALGGDVMASFGGASGRELAQAITDVNALTAAYQKVIDAYGLTHLDFDIEGAASADLASIHRRSQAIANLQANATAAGKTLNVWFTLPVLPTGLTVDGVNLLQSALRYGVRIDGVNIMTMDYGDGAAPNPRGQMGEYAIDAANSLFRQLQTLYGSSRTSAQLWSMIGVTPMIGLNDVTTETFDQEDAAQLTAFAEQHGMGRISIWSLNRDKQAPSGALSYVDSGSSSLVQQPFEFSKIFLPYQG